ncbi:MAG TPA: redoxin family protein [Acidobacteriaceae bacterium]
MLHYFHAHFSPHFHYRAPYKLVLPVYASLVTEVSLHVFKFLFVMKGVTCGYASTMTLGRNSSQAYHSIARDQILGIAIVLPQLHCFSVVKKFLLCSILLFPFLAHAQADTGPTADELLKQAAAVYARSGNFHIEQIEESIRSNELMNDRRNYVLTVIRGDNNRFRIETRASGGSWVQVSDGTTESIYRAESNAYVQHSLAGKSPYFYRAIFGDNNQLKGAWGIPVSLESIASRSVNATRTADETLTLGNHQFPCYVVHAESKEQTSESNSSRTFWIDKQTHVFRKVVAHERSYMIDGDIHIPFNWEKTTTYPVADMDVITPDSVFQFAPPQGAKLVEHLEPKWAQALPATTSASTFKPYPAPPVMLLDAAGKPTPLSEYRGKVVVIDLWATWCGPCIYSLPAFATLADAPPEPGMAVFSVDEDLKAQDATDYLVHHGYKWTNYHDRKREIQNAFGLKGIPQTLVIDRLGNVIFSGSSASSPTYEKDLQNVLKMARLSSGVPAKK